SSVPDAICQTPVKPVSASRSSALMVNVPCEPVKTKTSRKGPRAKGGRSGGAVAASVLSYEPESPTAPDAAQVPISGQQNWLGKALITTAPSGSALPVRETLASEAARVTTTAIGSALIDRLPRSDRQDHFDPIVTSVSRNAPKVALLHHREALEADQDPRETARAHLHPERRAAASLRLRQRLHRVAPGREAGREPTLAVGDDD